MLSDNPQSGTLLGLVRGLITFISVGEDCQIALAETMSHSRPSALVRGPWLNFLVRMHHSPKDPEAALRHGLTGQ